MRRLAVRHSIRQTVDLKQGLANSFCSDSTVDVETASYTGASLSPDAEVFVPNFCAVVLEMHADDLTEHGAVKVDADSCVFALEGPELEWSRKWPSLPSVYLSLAFGECGAHPRRSLQESRAEQLPELPSVCMSAVAITDSSCRALDVPVRRVMREVGVCDTLQEPLAVPRLGVVVTVVGAGFEAGSRPEHAVCRGLGHTTCNVCYVPDGRYGRNRRCVRDCAVIADGSWGPTKCNERCSPCDIMDHG